MSSPPTESHLSTLRVAPSNIREVIRTLRNATVDQLLVDTNDTCNVDCVYCPNPRSSQRIELAEFVELLSGPILRAHTFQFGCGQEPTADPRLTDFFRELARSRVTPAQVRMITNGTLLHRYPREVTSQWGLHVLQVSIDTADPAITRWSREGTKPETVVSNIRRFRADHPEVTLLFSSVVHRGTIDSVPGLLELGESLGVAEYYLRELFDHADLGGAVRRADYHDWIERLRLAPGEFRELEQRLADHPCVAKIWFLGNTSLSEAFDSIQQGERVIVAGASEDTRPPSVE